jgi:lysophospholipase L1-like esterase
MSARADHNGGVRRLRLLLAAGLTLVAGCGWDGPPRDVRAVTSHQVGTDVAAPPRASTATGEGATAAPEMPSSDDAPPPPGVDDRPGSFGSFPMPETVAVVGDSLTVAATEEIVRSLSRVGVRTVIVDGRESRRMASGSGDLPSGVDAIETILGEHRPDLWVVALGTNDVGAAVDAERFRSDLRETLATIPPAAPVVWVDVWIRDLLGDVVVANAMLHRELAARAAPTAVVDWFTHATADGVVTGDGVHLTEAGQVRFAAEIADAVVALALG